jgi:hypothetical protein
MEHNDGPSRDRPLVEEWSDATHSVDRSPGHLKRRWKTEKETVDGD